METSTQRFGRVFSWLFAAVWIAILVLVFLPLLVTGYLLRGLGTIICNGAYGIQSVLAYLGRQAEQP